MINIDDLIYNIEFEMLKKGIKKKDLYTIINRNTVSALFSKHEGNLDTLRKIINYVNSIEKIEK